MLLKQHRILRDADFQKIWKRGRSYYTKILGFKILKNNLTISRFSIIVSTKISKKTTVRNKIKRQIREIIRLKLPEITPGYDLTITALPAIVGKKYREIEKDIFTGLQHFKIIR